MKGLILINAYSTSDDYLYQPNRLKEEFEKKGVIVDIKRNNSFACTIFNNDISYEFDDYAFCVYLDKDKYILKCLSKGYIKVFNSYDAITVCDDKMLTYIELANNGIDMPKTLPGLLCYFQDENIPSETMDIIEHQLSYPLIIKESYGSLGQGVYLINDRTDLIRIMNKVKCLPHLVQEYVKTSYGRDLRVMVIGGKVVGGMLRTSNGDFRSNLGAGGYGMPFNISDNTKEIAIKVASLLDLDYCGIDFLFGTDGAPIVCEVNSNAFFHGFEQNTGINVAQIYVEHILNQL